MDVFAWVGGVLGTALIGWIAVEIVQAFRRRGLQLVRARGTARGAVRHDPRDSGFLELITWSRERPLIAERLQFRGRGGPGDLIEPSAWNAFLDDPQFADLAGMTAYPIAIGVDHHESADDRDLKLTIARSEYAQAIAIGKFADAHPEVRDQVKTRLAERGIEAFVASMPPTSLSMNVNVVSRSGGMLVLRRSGAVRTFRNQWSVGINETMKYSEEPGNTEGLLQLCHRALAEELGLRPEDYGKPMVSLLGFSLPAMCYGAFATVHLASGLSEEDVLERRLDCHSIYEHDRTEWLPLRPHVIDGIVAGGNGPDGESPWIYFAGLSAREAWRTRVPW